MKPLYAAIETDKTVSGISGNSLDCAEVQEPFGECKEVISEKLEFTRRILSASSIGIITYNEAGQCVFANEAAAEMVEMDVETLLQQNFHFTQSWKRSGMYEAAQRALDTNTEQQVEGHIITTSGREIWLDLRFSSFQFNGDKYLLLYTEDITEHKKAAEMLRMSEQRLAESQQVARIGSWSWDIVNNKLDWSEEACRRFDQDLASFTPTVQYYVDRIHPDDRASVQKAIQDSLENNARYHIQPRIKNENGREWVLEGFGIVERDANGKPRRFAGTVQDITERRRVEEQIRQSEEFVRNILDTVDEGFIVIDRDYRIQTANKAYCSQVGGCSEELVGMHCYAASHKSNRPCFENGEECAARQVWETGKSHSVLHRHKDTNENILYVETKAFPITDESGAVTLVIETINNITERHLLEEERLKTQKLESIGTLAGGIAHDFNNLLQGIFGYIALAKMTANNPEKSTAALAQAEKAIQQSVNLTSQLLTFSKGGKPVKKQIELRSVIESSAKLMLSGSRSELSLTIQDDLWRTEADAGQLGQVIQNIVLNADQAMPTGGTVKITATNRHEGDASLPHGLAPGKYVVIAIQDTGIGIPEQYLSKIFDPYFTSKEKGSGLGLATSYSIVRNHGGMIDVRTKSGAGTTFQIYLPALAVQVRKEPAVILQEPIHAARARVLLMDDDEMIRDLSSHLITMLGHDVEVAHHGEEALTRYQGAIAAGSPFDIVILDLTIRGGMGGSETIRNLLKIDPLVKAVVSSGYSDDAAIPNYLSQGFKACLKKPYDVAALSEVLGKTLAC